MIFLRFILRNTARHKLRVLLTVLGIAIVVLAFGILRTTVAAWYAEAEGTTPDRLITRHAVSLSIHLPVAYQQIIGSMDGVTGVTYANWFGGRYKDGKQFFAKIAVDPDSYLDLHTEILVPPEERQAFLQDRRGALVGQALAEKQGWNIGDVIPIEGTLYPGNWEFIIRGIYTGATPSTAAGNMYIHWKAMNERRQLNDPDRASTVGWLITRIENPSQAAQMSQIIDERFTNSPAETRTETERAFEMGFVAMSGALIQGLQVMSVIVMGISMLVLANAMAMAVRERTHEYAILKTLGFRLPHLAYLIIGESLTLSIVGGLLGILMTIPACQVFGKILTTKLGSFFPAFSLEPSTLILAMSITIGVGFFSALIPLLLCAQIKITSGLRNVG